MKINTRGWQQQQSRRKFKTKKYVKDFFVYFLFLKLFQVFLHILISGKCYRLNPESIVNLIVGSLCQDILNFLLFLLRKIILWEFNIKCYVESSEKVVVLIIGHAFTLLANSSTRPCYFLPRYLYLVTIKMRNFHCKSNQCIL